MKTLSLLLTFLLATQAFAIDFGTPDQVYVVPHAGGRAQFGQVDLTKSAALKNQLAVGNGGTGLASGTSGGIPYFNATSTMASSGLLASGGIVLGGGAGASPTTITGTADQVCREPHAGGAPAFGSLDLSQSATVGSSILGHANGGTDVSSPGSTNNVLVSNGTNWTSGAAPAHTLTVVAKTANYTATSTDDVINCDSSGGAFTITIPAASSNSGKVLMIRKTDSTVNNFVAVTAADNIDGVGTYNLSAQYSFVQIVSNGTTWVKIAERNPWLVDAIVAGTTSPSLGTGQQLSWLDVEQTGMSITTNTGSLTGWITCSGTTAATSASVCTSGTTSIGVSFQLPNPGPVRACLTFTHDIDFSASNQGGDLMTIAETPNNAQTHTQEINAAQTDYMFCGSTATRCIKEAPVTLCGTLKFSTSGQKTLRLYYEQSVSGAANASSIDIANLQIGVNDKTQIHWEVTPLL